MNDNPPAAVMIDGPACKLATVSQEGSGPGLLWLGGYASDMRGGKATAVAAFAEAIGARAVRFDYRGHGESEGAFEDGTIGAWAEDAAHVLTHHTTGPQVLIGSSMGGWMACLLAKRYPERVHGMVLIAPAPDFTTALAPHQWPDEHWATLQRDGRIAFPREDGTEAVYTKRLFDEGAAHLVLDQPLAVPGRVRILTGMADDVVPPAHVLRLADHIECDDLTLTMVKGGDHRLSTDADLGRLTAAIAEVRR